MASKRFSVEAVFMGIDKISKPVRSMGRSISKFVRNSNRQIGKLGAKFKMLGSFMGKAIIGGAAVAAAAMGSAVVKTAELGDEAAKTSRRLGITAEALQELRFAADRQGVSSKLLGSSFTALQKRVGELKSGTGSLYAFLNKTGDKTFIKQLSLAKNTEQAFELITKKVSTIKDPMEKAAFASAAFSRAGIDMIKFMEAGTDGIAKLREEARKYGAVISNDAAANSELFIDAMTNFKSVVSGVALTLGSKLMPFLTKVIQGFADFWAGNKKFISQGIDKFISTIANVLRFVAPVFETVFIASKKLFEAFGKAATSLLPDFSVKTETLQKTFNLLLNSLEFMEKIGIKAFEFIQFASPFLKPFIATLLIYKGVLIAVALATKAWAVVTGIINAVMAMNPVTLIVIAVAALVAGIILLVKNWDFVVVAFKTGVDKVWGFLSSLLDNPFIATLGVIFLPFITIPALIIKHWIPIKEFFTGLWSDISGAFNITLEFIQKKFNDVVLVVKKFVDEIWNFFVDLMDNPFFRAAGAIMGKIFGGIKKALESPLKKAGEIAVVVGDKIKSSFESATTSTNKAFDAIGKGFTKTKDAVKSFISGLTERDIKIPKIELPKIDSKSIKTAIKADLKLLPKIEKTATDAVRAITPSERLSRSIQENTDRSIESTTNENNSILTIRDKTGNAELVQQNKGPKIRMEQSGAA